MDLAVVQILDDLSGVRHVVVLVGWPFETITPTDFVGSPAISSRGPQSVSESRRSALATATA